MSIIWIIALVIYGSLYGFSEIRFFDVFILLPILAIDGLHYKNNRIVEALTYIKEGFDAVRDYIKESNKNG